MDGISEDKPVVNRFSKPSATIHTLAPELLTEIFLHCVDTNGHLRHLSRPPLLLGRVCSRWRIVSADSPVLWTRFAIIGHRWSRIDWKKDLEATKVWMSRSGSCPLTICLVYSQLWGEQLLMPILESLVSQSWRWENVYISIPSEFESVILAPFWTGRLHQLQSFDCCLDGIQVANSEDVRPLALSSAPQLQSFRHVREVGGHIDFGGRIHTVKILEIRYPMDSGTAGMSPGDLLTCLTHCPLLEELTFLITEFGSIHPQELPPIIELCHLRHFYLALSAGIDPGYLFGVLFVPALEKLTLLMKVDNNHYTDWPHLRPMLARSRPPLRSLALYRVPVIEKTLCECLSYIPSLTFLGLGGTECTDIILNFLTTDKNDTSRRICPCLDEIEFRHASRFSSSAMISMILSRHPSNTNIENRQPLKLIDCRESQMEWNASSNSCIAECIEAGLVFHSPDTDMTTIWR
ncbi:hypothetical protein BD410DRAFT_789860 [Rickenella mellea]|uniref:F-box domain-containing protein n=1 Tax=Rickenella mellea TaxID=50990 RepID=A0A4Y7Q279_9AGAM|nr:hypothetical protein BD410DRAFT_789860 [Rickenella mellea]